MRIAVLLNGRQIYGSSFTICRVRRADITPAQARRRLVFFFKGRHIHQGQYRTSHSQVVEGNIWEAGGDPDDLLLGLSFSTKRRELLNTIHIMKPDRISVSTLDRGLVVKTYPVSGSRPTGQGKRP